MKIVLAAALVAVAGQAQALSCLRADVARTFGWASEAQERYVIMLGAFTFSPPVEDETDINNRQSVQLPATFSGVYLGAGGFVAAPTLDVTLRFECFGPWCGSIENNGDTLAFVEQTADGYVLNVDPCFSTVFAPNDANVQSVLSCMRGTGCQEKTF
jgi:hypothetical protein